MPIAALSRIADRLLSTPEVLADPFDRCSVPATGGLA